MRQMKRYQKSRFHRAHGGSATTELIGMLLLILAIVGGLVWSIHALYKQLSKQSKPLAKAVQQAESASQAASPNPTTPAPRPTERSNSRTVDKATTAVTSSAPVAVTPVQSPTTTASQTATLSLPVDWPELIRRAEITLTVQNATTVKLVVSRATSAFSLRIKGCAPLALPATSNEPLFVVAPSEPLPILPSTSVQTFSLTVASIDPATFRKPPLNQNLQLVQRPVDGRLTTFMETVSARTSNWRVVQAGVWILSRNIASTDMDSLRIPITNPMNGQTAVGPLGDYSQIKAVEAILMSLGWNPDSFRIFREEETKLKGLLGQSAYSTRRPGYDAIITSGALARYKGNSQVVQRLRDCMRQHPRHSLRCSAFTNLLAVGLTEAPDTLRHMAEQHPDTRERFLAAWTLVDQGQDDGLPFLALCATDPLLGPLADRTAAQIIALRSGVNRTTGENAFDYWVRTMDAAAYKQSPRLEGAINRAITRTAHATNSTFTTALQDMASPDDSRVQAACSQLTAFPQSETAFRALARAASTHSSKQVRNNALQMLRNFQEFSPASVCAAILVSDDDSQYHAAISLLCGNIFNDSLPVLEKAMRHDSTYVQRLVIQQAGEVPLPELAPQLIKLARHSTDTSMRVAATHSLCQLHHPEGFKTITSFLRSGEKDKKREAMNLVPVWGFDTAMLELLRKYKSDADIGEQATRHLSEHPVPASY